MARRFTVEAVFAAVDRVSAPLNRMQQRVGRFARGASRQLERLNNLTNRIGSAMWSGFRVGALAAAGAITALFLAIRSYAAEADSLAKQSRRLEFDIGALQEYSFVFQQAGLTTDEYDKTLKELNKRMGEARAGQGALYTYLARTDRGLLRQLQNTNSLEAALDLMIDTIARQEDPMRRAALANAAFGRAGAKMANVAELGVDGIRALRQEMRENGLITMQAANDAENYNDAMNSLRLSARAALWQGLAPLLPMLTQLTRAARTWINENREELINRITGAVIWLTENYDRLWDRAKLVAKIAGYFIAVGLAVKALNGALLLTNLLMAANPITRIVLAVIGLAAAIAATVDDWDALVWAVKKRGREIGEMFTNLGHLLGKWLFKLVDTVKEIGGSVVDAFVGLWYGAWDLIDEYARGTMKGWKTDLINMIPGAQLFRATGTFLQGQQEADEADEADEDRREQQRIEGPQALVTPAQRTAREIQESTERTINELVIRDETGRAEPSGPAWAGGGLTMIRTGAFR